MSEGSGGGTPHGPIPALAQITSIGPWTASHSAMACFICILPQVALSIHVTAYQALIHITGMGHADFSYQRHDGDRKRTLA